MKQISILLIAILCFLPYYAKSQGSITVTSNHTATDLAQHLAGNGVTVSNATFNNCDTSANGVFRVVNSNIGMDSGIILTSGSAQGAFGPSAVPFQLNSNFTDPDLDLLTTQAIHDACVLEFDFVPTGDTVKFQYIFGSAEYQSFTCSGYEDIFGFFISGPGITGAFSNNAINIAYIPGTTCPITINSINASTANPCGSTVAPCAPPNNALFYNNLPIGNTLTGMAYNGYTLKMPAIAQVIPCQTYHLKLAIADASDQTLDTGVLLEAGSLSSNGYTAAAITGLSAVYPYLVEGCDTATVTIKRKIYNGSTFADSVQVITFGTATSGVDYNTLPNYVYFTNSILDTIQSFQLYAPQDNIPESGEFIYLVIAGGCNNQSADTVKIELKDSLYITLNNTNKNICLGDSVIISGIADTNIAITWTPASGVANPNKFLTSIKPITYGSTYYGVTGHYLTCPTVTRGFTLTTDPIPNIQPLSNRDLCLGDTAHLSAIVSPPFNYNMNWLPTTGLAPTNNYNTTFNGTNTQTYTVTAVSPNASCSSSKTVTLNVWPYASGAISDDTLVCSGVPVQLWATSNMNVFNWWPTNGLSCTSCPNPIATTLGTTDYFVALIEPHGCNDTLTTRVENHPPFNLQLLTNDTTINYGESINLIATGAPYYMWSPSMFLSSQVNGTVTCIPTQDITYVVTGYSLLNGCPQTDTVRVHLTTQDIYIPNIFTPNKDGNNDFFKPFALKEIRALEFRVFNRWGNEVYSSNNIYEGWNGQVKGKDADAGTYYYYIRVAYPNGYTNSYRGDIILMR